MDLENPHVDAELVDDPRRLPEVVDALRPLEVLALDTEFLWERTYYPRLALLQVAGRAADGRVRAFAVDPLAIEDLGPLLDLVAEPGRLKVVHAGRIDLQILERMRGTPPGPVFDTQRAAALLGHGAQVGYGNLVEAVLGMTLEKGEQYTDWTRRPLRDTQIRYALLDVVPLLEVYARLHARLEELGRLTWAEEESAELLDPGSYAEDDPRELYKKIKHKRQLRDRRALGVLRELAAWRDREARRRDLRPTFVLRDPILLEVAREQPTSARALQEVRSLRPADLKRHGDALVKAVRRALDLPDELPSHERGKRPKESVGPTVDLMRAFLSQRSEQHGVASEVLATVSELERLARDRQRERFVHDHRILTGWRRDLVGDELLRLLKGKLGLSVDPDSSEVRAVEAVPPPEE